VHINLSRPKSRAAVGMLGLPRVTTGRLSTATLESLLPPADLLTVSLCGTPDFVRVVRDQYISTGLPRSLLHTVG
jgi:hypothetical protein